LQTNPIELGLAFVFAVELVECDLRVSIIFNLPAKFIMAISLIAGYPDGFYGILDMLVVPLDLPGTCMTYSAN